MSVSSWDYITSNDTIINDVRKDLERNGHDLIWISIGFLAWRDCGKLQNECLDSHSLDPDLNPRPAGHERSVIALIAKNAVSPTWKHTKVYYTYPCAQAWKLMSLILR